MRILVTPTSISPDRPGPALEKLQAFTSDLRFNPFGRKLTESELIELIQDCDGLLVSLDPVSAKVIEASPKLKVISRYGAGYDTVDLAAASRLGIKVTNTPGANAVSVAELAFGMLIALARQFPVLDKAVRANLWPRLEGTEIRGNTLGIIGLGRIGKLMAGFASSFGMRVLANDLVPDLDFCQRLGIESVSKVRINQEADFISYHLPLTPLSKHLVNRAALEEMKDGVILVNTARGGIFAEDDVYQALKSGKIRGLGIDVYQQEPAENSPFTEFPNVIMTPHAGAHTAAAAENMAMTSVANLLQVLKGEPCPNIVNEIAQEDR